MQSHEPVSLSRITTAFTATIEDLEKLRGLSKDQITERDRVIKLLKNLADILTVAVPCYGTFVPDWLKSE